MTFVKIKPSNISLAMRKLVFGMGINDANYMVTPHVNGKQVICPVYRKWKDMLKRCYSAKFLSKHKTYIGCSVCNEWLTFSVFAKWYDKHNIKGYALDKDIKIKGNKIYSPNACLFVTVDINTLFNDAATIRGLYKIGVDNKSGRYRARIRIDCKDVHLGLFSTEPEAHKAYIKAKNTEIKRKMQQYPEFAIYLEQYIK